jgi:penicillin amidase
VGQYHLSDGKAPFASRHAASLRAIYDLADLDRSVFIYQTGQSGNVFAAEYRDMANDWSQGKYRSLTMHPKRVTQRLILQPTP